LGIAEQSGLRLPPTAGWEATIRIQQAIEAISRKVSHQEHRLRDSLERQGVIFADKLRDSGKALVKFKEQ
jgi:hypothetical protein